jgi:hypothetical protein
MATDCAQCGSCVPYSPEMSCCDNWGDLDDDLLCRAIDLAWMTLRSLSGGLVGNCPVLIRPCLTPAPCGVCEAAACSGGGGLPGGGVVPPGTVEPPITPCGDPFTMFVVPVSASASYPADHTLPIETNIWGGVGDVADTNVYILPVIAQDAAPGSVPTEMWAFCTQPSFGNIRVGDEFIHTEGGRSVSGVVEDVVDPGGRNYWAVRLSPSIGLSDLVQATIQFTPVCLAGVDTVVTPDVVVDSTGRPMYAPQQLQGAAWGDVCGQDGCSCGPLSEIILPGQVAEVWQVRIDGVALPVTSYRVDNGNRLVRTDGRSWPSCQYMDRDVTSTDVSVAQGTMGIWYVPGIKPSAAGLWAAGVLTCEFAKACSGGKCRLPTAVTSIARQGVTMEFSTGMFPDGMTGIREVDAYLTSINPYALRTPPKVWSPDLVSAKHRYTTWQASPVTPPVNDAQVVGP